MTHDPAGLVKWTLVARSGPPQSLDVTAIKMAQDTQDPASKAAPIDFADCLECDFNAGLSVHLVSLQQAIWVCGKRISKPSLDVSTLQAFL